MKPSDRRRLLPTTSVRLAVDPLLVFASGLVLALSLGTASCGQPRSELLAHQDLFSQPYDAEPADLGKLEVDPPPFSEGIFPCSDCHEPDMPVKTKRRKLRHAHQEIVLKHDEKHRWCLDCHSQVDFDKLHLASGELIDFEHSYQLCGQCHGDKYRDWRRGVHGRRSGSWNGEKTYLLCVNCHNAHDPAFKPIVPKPPPQRPKRSP